MRCAWILKYQVPVARFLCHRVHRFARRCAFQRVRSCWSPVRAASYGRGRRLMQLMDHLMMAVPRRLTERFRITTDLETVLRAAIRPAPATATDAFAKHLKTHRCRAFWYRFSVPETQLCGRPDTRRSLRLKKRVIKPTNLAPNHLAGG
jgi:hypothetical protein